MKSNPFQSLLGFLMRCDGSMFLYRVQIDEFQSLLGFLMRCDEVIAAAVVALLLVSIPAGFSDALRLDIYLRTHRPPIMVSIPAGFSDALRPMKSVL